FGRDLRDSLCHSNLCWNWGRRLRSSCPDNFIGFVSNRDTRSRDGGFLRGNSSWQRAWLCYWRSDRCSLRLALGILSRYSAGFVAWPFVFLATRSASWGTSTGAEIAASQSARLRETLPHALVSHQLRRANIDDFCNGWSGVLGLSLSALSESKSGRWYDDLWLDHRSLWSGLDT